MDVILTISFKITAEIEIRKHVLRRTSQRSSQTRCIGFVKHTMYVLSFIHCREMRSVFVVVCFKLSLAPFYAARSSLTAFAGGFSVEKALNKKPFAERTSLALVV